MNDEHVSLDKKNLQDNRLSFMKIITKKNHFISLSFIWSFFIINKKFSVFIKSTKKCNLSLLDETQS